MSGHTQPPKAVVVFDVNVLIDAVNPASHNHATAVRALSDDNGMPIYLSDMMLKTTANKLLELGADPEVVREYLEFVMDEESYGPEIHVLGYIPITDYGLIDKHGNPDYEDSTVVSLMDAAEHDAHLPAVLVTSDGALRRWCQENSRMAARPDQLPLLTEQHQDDIQKASYDYLSRKMFTSNQRIQRGPAQRSTKEHARDLVMSVRKEIADEKQAALTPEERVQQRYQRFPELHPKNRARQEAAEQESQLEL